MPLEQSVSSYPAQIGKYTSCEVYDDLASEQEEADARMITHLLDILQGKEDMSVVVRSSDTDVECLLLHYFTVYGMKGTLIMDSGVGDNRRLIDINCVAEDIGTEACCSVVGWHYYTGSDTTSALVRRGKVRPWKLLLRFPQYMQAFAQLGMCETLDEKYVTILEEFHCKIYGDNKEKSINKLRYKRFIKSFTPKSSLLSTSCGTDASLLPPCSSSVRQHIQRVNYQSYISKNAARPLLDIPDPCLHGWTTDGSGFLVPQRLGDEMMPAELEDIVLKIDINNDDENPDADLVESQEFQQHSILDTIYEEA